MSSPISRVTMDKFVAELGRDGGAIDLNAMTSTLAGELEKAGVDLAKLKDIAGKDGVIRGRAELAKLFRVVDGFDHNGRDYAFDVTNKEGQNTPVHQLYEALKGDAGLQRQLRPVDEKRFVSELGKKYGTIDTLHLSPDLKDAFTKYGIDEAALAKVAGPDGLIRGEAEMKALFTLVDQSESDGHEGQLTSAQRVGDKADVTAAGALFGLLKKEVDLNSIIPVYRRPGTVVAPRQTPLTVQTNALVVDVANRLPAIKLDVKGVNQFDLYPTDEKKGGRACFEAATKQCTTFNVKAFGSTQPHLEGPDQAIQIGISEDSQGRLEIDPDRAKIGRAYIDRCLDAGYPALVAVSYVDDGYNTDKLSDHFVTIHTRDYDADGRLYYEFKDPGANGGTDRFYVDAATGKLFKEGDKRGGYVMNLDYEVTQVRTYKELR